MHATMHVGVFFLIDPAFSIDHHTRLLRAGGTVQVNQGFVVDLTRQDREIRAHAGDIKGCIAGKR